MRYIFVFVLWTIVVTGSTITCQMTFGWLYLPRSRGFPKNYQDNAILTAFQDSGKNIAKRQKAQNDKVVR